MLVPTIVKISPITMIVAVKLMTLIVAMVRSAILVSTGCISYPAGEAFLRP
jgi:hypothetical protein